MKRIVLAVAVLVAFATGCGHGRRTSSAHPHNLSAAGTVAALAVGAGIVGLLIWAGSACDSCGEETTPGPRAYPYPESTEW